MDPILPKKNIKFLGILIDDRLDFKQHVNFICKKIRSLSYTLIKLKSFLSTKHKTQIYRAIIQPHTEYCIPIWGHASNFTSLCKLQKKCLRIIVNARSLTHTSPILKSTGILKSEDLYVLKSLLLLHKIILNKTPAITSSYYIFIKNEKRKQNIFYVPFVTTTFSQNLPNYRLPSLWNTKKNEININCSSAVFKQQLKDLMLDSYSSKCTIQHCYVCN